MRRFSPLILAALFAAPLSAQAKPKAATLDTAVFAGGCFWGVDAVFKHVKGVTEVVSGYAGGHTNSPSYEQVSSGETGHAESVRVIYDPAVVPYTTLLKVFFFVAHDPTELNHQGPDDGTQYRSAIFYRSEVQKKEATDYIAQITKQKAYSRPIVTEVTPLNKFFMAEGYHQNYLALHPDQAYIVYNDIPKVEHLKKGYPELYHEPTSK